ncbi:ABC transporter permease [Leucobacter aridicollis]|uniref:ABC transporter permease n=1 Tax=Leucobacter aridicollis TaxID=283878 RepID=UPI000E65BCEE|nr:ABC transporter permease subunit [Leucobacter aridicollis]UTX54317.1 ABC transporter permease subunit [Leucobacter aridicollis]
MNRQRILTIARKDLSEVLRNKQTLAPLLVVPIMFAAIFPAAIALLGRSPIPTASVNGLDAFLDNIPEGVLPPDLDTGGVVVYAALTYFMAPLFLLIPVMVASVVASSSFVGEKERRTLEGLLYTPVTNRELVLGKVLASLVPAVVITWGSFAIYTVIANVLGNPVVGRTFFPNPTWLIVVFLLVPVIAFLAITLIVAVSGRSTTVQGAQGISVLVLLPVLALVIGQATGLMLFDAPIALIAVVVIAAIDVAVFLAVAKTFERERLITKLT